MGEPSFETPTVAAASERRLDSWKEIASYLNRDVTTVQRWEKREGMPVHRHLHRKRGSVYAIAHELDAWVRGRRPPPDEPSQQPPTQASAPTKAVPPSSTPRFRPAARLGIAVAAALCLGLSAAWLAFRHRTATPAVQPAIRSLAVLPLRNLSGSPAQDYLADGITEALISRLSQIHDLRVVSHTSVMRFSNPQISIPEIAKTLNVDAVVEGSVIREGARIRVTAQLIRAATDTHIWSQTYDRELRDALALQSELAQAVAERVEVTVTGQERQRLAAVRPVAPEVYESYLKGRFDLEQGNKAAMQQSILSFQDAVQRDPTCGIL